MFCKSTIVLHLKVNIYIMNNRWLVGAGGQKLQRRHHREPAEVAEPGDIYLIYILTYMQVRIIFTVSEGR